MLHLNLALVKPVNSSIFILSLPSCFYQSTGVFIMEKLRVCIIGAGAAGLVAIQNISSTPGITGIVYEASSRIGGVWVYQDKPGFREDQTLCSPLYHDMTYVKHCCIWKHQSLFMNLSTKNVNADSHAFRKVKILTF